MTLTWRTAGESHGPALVAILEGFPAGFPLDLQRVDAELARRQEGYGRGGRMKIERDRASLLSGTRAGSTLGSPITLSLENRDATIEKLAVPTNPRPGHADLAGCQKYGVRDPRLVLERASARETAARVALGGVARQLLEYFGVELFAHVVELGTVHARPDGYEAAGEDRAALRAASEFHCLDAQVEANMRAEVDAARDARDTLGGVFEVQVSNLPPGLGGYADPAERLTSRLGAALFSIPAMKGVEFGTGFQAARTRGSDFHDAIIAQAGAYGRFARATNRAGGLEGGMTTGEPLIMRVAMKPISTLRQGVATIDFESGEEVLSTYQRSDVTSVPAASVVGEAVVALELARAFLGKFGGDSLDALRDGFEVWRARVREL